LDHYNQMVGQTMTTGASYYRARYYDPSSGRFLTEDPLGGDFGDNNFYLYVDNEPIDRLDPLGLVFCVYRVTFHFLLCQSDDGSQWFDTNQMRSGFGPNCVNNRACEAKSGGPIPEGEWTFGVVGDTPRPYKTPRIPIRKKPETNDYNRSPGFEAHPGINMFSSTGCLAMNPSEYKRFLSFFSADGGGSLSVRP